MGYPLEGQEIIGNHVVRPMELEGNRRLVQCDKAAVRQLGATMQSRRSSAPARAQNDAPERRPSPSWPQRRTAPTRAPGSSFHRPRRIRGSGAGRDTPDPSDLAPGGAAGLRRRHRTEAVVLCSAAADVDHRFFVPDSVGSMAGRDAIACPERADRDRQMLLHVGRTLPKPVGTRGVQVTGRRGGAVVDIWTIYVNL